tara:strand:+ start:285 stop:578 length:294 start_codon:yes stop_codon:yes gene_type:complete
MQKTCNGWRFFGGGGGWGELWLWLGGGASCGNQIPQRAREAVQARWLALIAPRYLTYPSRAKRRHNATWRGALLRLITIRNINICLAAIDNHSQHVA